MRWLDILKQLAADIGAILADIFHDPHVDPQTLPMNQNTPPTPPISPQEASNTPTPTPTPSTQNTPPATQISMLVHFATCIRDYEGTYPNGLNWRLNNPGNCRYSSAGYLAKYGNVECIDTDTDPRYLYHKGKFAKFPTYGQGWDYLLNLIKVKVAQHPAWTIKDFMRVYSPAADSNDPDRYAAYIASRLGVTVDYPMKNIVA